MQLTDEQLKYVETFGGLNYTPEKIAMMLNLDGDEFLEDFNMSQVDPAYRIGQVRFHYDLGLLKAATMIDKANLKRAEEGNLTSIAQYKKDTLYRELQNAKNRTIYQQERSYIEGIQGLIENGDTSKLTPVQVQFVTQLDYIRILYLRQNSKAFIINAVRRKWPELSRRAINQLYCESLNYFYQNNDICMDAWRNMLAEKMENLSNYASEINNVEEARKCLMDVATLRGLNKDQPNVIPKELLDRRRRVFTMDIHKIGLPVVNKFELAAFIDKLALTIKEKAKCRREAMIEDTPFEIILDDDKD